MEAKWLFYLVLDVMKVYRLPPPPGTESAYSLDLSPGILVFGTFTGTVYPWLEVEMTTMVWECRPVTFPPTRCRRPRACADRACVEMLKPAPELPQAADIEI